MPIILAQADLALILADVASAPGVERCGLLLGDEDSIVAVRPCPNVASNPAAAFEIDPAALLQAMRQARQGGPPPIGHYHSHPNGDPHPSACDAAAAAADGRLWLIVGGGEAGLWRAVPDGAIHGRFDPVRWRLRTRQGLQDRPALFRYCAADGPAQGSV